MTDQTLPARSHRRFIWLGLAVLAAIGIWTAGWFYIGSELVAQTQNRIAALNASGRRANCEQAEARGFPFRIGLNCRSVLYEDSGRGLSVAAGPFRSAAQVYDPLKVVTELDGPALLELPGLIPLKADWTLMHASARLVESLPQRASLEGRGLRVSSADPAQTGELGKAENIQVHFQQVNTAVDLAVSAASLALSPAAAAGRAVPPLGLDADIRLDDGLALLTARPLSLRGHSGTLRGIRIQGPDGESFRLSGPFSVDSQGRIDADLTLGIEKPKVLAERLSGIFPEQRDTITSIFSGFAAMAGGKQAAAIPLTIRAGKPVILFFTLDELPRLP